MTSLRDRFENRAFEWLARLNHRFHVSALFPNRQNAVLMYHSVGDPEQFGDVSPERLWRDLRYLTATFQVVDLPDVLSSPTDGPKRVAITFDDGFQTFYDNAFPIIQSFDVPVTVFVPVGLVEGGAECSYRLTTSPEGLANFNDSKRYEARACVDPATMTVAQLRELVASDLVTLGNHTRTHPDLSRITDRETLRSEITSAREELEDLLDVSVDRFCYPYGRYNAAALEEVRTSHRYAVTTTPRLLDEDPDPHRIPRLSAHRPEPRLRWDLSDLRWYLGDRFGHRGPPVDKDMSGEWKV